MLVLQILQEMNISAMALIFFFLIIVLKKDHNQIRNVFLLSLYH